MSEPQTIPFGYCQCGCGMETKRAATSDSKRGLVKGAPRRYRHGHQARKALPIGERFGLLTVVRGAGVASGGQPLVWCQCECGGTKVARLPKLREGATTSCGCRRGKRNPHGLGNHELMGTWRRMLYRCLNPACRTYSYYGGRGITVCDRWQGADGFLHFLEDMGDRPSPKHSIDRIDNDGPYAPGNCRWATAKEQAANRRPRPGYRDPLPGGA